MVLIQKVCRPLIMVLGAVGLEHAQKSEHRTGQSQELVLLLIHATQMEEVNEPRIWDSLLSLKVRMTMVALTIDVYLLVRLL